MAVFGIIVAILVIRWIVFSAIDARDLAAQNRGEDAELIMGVWALLLASTVIGMVIFGVTHVSFLTVMRLLLFTPHPNGLQGLVLVLFAVFWGLFGWMVLVIMATHYAKQPHDQRVKNKQIRTNKQVPSNRNMFLVLAGLWGLTVGAPLVLLSVGATTVN